VNANTVATSPPPPADTVLRPRLLSSVGLGIAGAFLLLAGARILQGLGWHLDSLLALPLPVLGAFWLWTAKHNWRRRAALSITVGAERFAVGEDSVRRFQVTGVRRHRTLRFDGVRIDCGSQRWLGIPSAQHVPRRVLAVFRRYGYPVDLK